MVLVQQRTQLKNRIHATLAKYALHDLEVSDLFATRGRALLRQRLTLLPPHTAYATEHLLEQIESLDRQVGGLEQRIKAVFTPTPAIQLLMTLPGVADPRRCHRARGGRRHRRKAGRLRGDHSTRPR
jgi:transposase